MKQGIVTSTDQSGGIAEEESLNPSIRSSNFLAPGDSVFRAVEMLRDGALDTLPILDATGGLIGVISTRDLSPLLASAPGDEALLAPVYGRMREPRVVGSSGMSVAEARDAFSESGETTLMVVDESDRFVGVITLADLLVQDPTSPRPPSIGGMATPWGVYLTNGSIQAGVGNWALLGSGALLGALMVASYSVVETACWAIQKTTGAPVFHLWNAPAPAQITAANLGWFLLQGLALPVFLLLMRAAPLAGYHAAEHQVVHAMERNEPLYPEVVARMPRVHPRCGTNLMAGVLIFGLVVRLLSGLGLGLGTTDSAMLAALTALFTWRSVGSAMQQHFTTRPPNRRQIEAGIAAAEDLDRKYLTTALRRPSIFRRMWCMGLPQMVLGSSASGFVAGVLWSLVEPYLK